MDYILKCGHENYPLTKYKRSIKQIKVFQNKVLRKIFESKEDKAEAVT
jgi:hypothetical protein